MKQLRLAYNWEQFSFEWRWLGCDWIELTGFSLSQHPSLEIDPKACVCYPFTPAVCHPLSFLIRKLLPQNWVYTHVRPSCMSFWMKMQNSLRSRAPRIVLSTFDHHMNSNSPQNWWKTILLTVDSVDACYFRLLWLIVVKKSPNGPRRFKFTATEHGTHSPNASVICHW